MSKQAVTQKKRRARVPRYYFKRYLCTASEWRFRQVLEAAIGERFDILYQVRVAALLRPKVDGDWERHGRSIAQWAFDFVLVAKGTSAVHCAIELDDRSHEDAARVARDKFLDEACRKAGLPLVRVRVRRRYIAGELKEMLEDRYLKGTAERKR